MPEDVDTLFPADQKQDVDSLFPPEVEKQNYRQSQGASPVQDLIFGDTSVNPVARVLDSFGQGAKQNWGADKPGISDETANYLKKAGIFNDYDKGQNSIIKAANEALIRSAATSLDQYWRVATRTGPAVTGGLVGAVSAVSPWAGEKLETGIEVAQDPGLQATLEGLSPVGALAGGAESILARALPRPLAEARNLGIIGEGEAGWKGTVERVPQAAGESAADAQAVKATAEAHEPLPGQPETETAAPVAAQAEPPTPDIHAVARQIAPQTFQEYDALAARQDTFRRWIDELRETRDQDAQANAPHADEIEELQNKILDATPRLAKKYQARLDPLIEARDAYIAEQTSRDSSDMTKIRDQLMQTDYRMRDLAPDVSKAYRDAAQQMPETVNAGAEPAEQGPAAPVQESAEAVPAPAEAAPQAQGAQPVPAEDRQPTASSEAQAGQQPAQAAEPVKQLPLTPSPSIVSDVRQKLVAAGRPTEEADAAANLVSAYWQTRAERFEGRKGTADEMYAAEGPEIKAGKGKSAKQLELAQGKTFNQTVSPSSPEFKKWFGESRVVDDSGNPRIVYHGTTDAIEAFDKSKRGTTTGVESAKKGFFFTSDPNVAASYAAGSNPYESVPFFRFINRVTGGYYEKFNEVLLRPLGKSAIRSGENIVPAYLSIEHPLEVDFKGGDYREQSFAELIDKAKADGHDGVVFRNTIDPGFNGGESPSDVYVAFEPTQIKSAIGNKGTFDPNDPRILHQEAKGRIRLRDHGHSTITLLKNADASTFIHETGHEWLDRMLRDAKDEQAPEDLKTDAGTVLKWLGADSAEDLKTRHHEKFARGFETYMMEGRAPTQALASVFAKFKDWLTRIYNVVTALKAPISDDIRDVFDRLLTRNPERAVVAPETESPRNFADEHEAKAEAAPPEQADHVGDIVQQERDSVGGKSLVEGNDARLADTGAEASRSAPRGEEPPGDANAPGPAGGEAGATPESGAVGAGGSEIAPEGNRARDSEEPVAPSDQIPRSETHLIDKAGNIRLDNLNTPEDLNVILRDTADKNNDFMDQRAVVPDAEVLKLAQAAGVDATILDLKRFADEFGRGALAAKTRKMRDILVQSAASVQELANKAADGTDADVLAFAEAQERHRMIQGTLSGVTAETGRTMRAFQSIKAMGQAKEIGAAVSDTTGKTLYQLRKQARRISQLDTPEQISGFVYDSNRPGLFDWLQSVFVNWLISGPLTHAGYTAAGEALAYYRAIGVTGASALVGTARRTLGLGGDEYAHFGEMVQQLYGIGRGNRNGIKASWRAWKSGQTELPPEVLSQQGIDPTAGQTASNMFGSIPNPKIAGVTVPIGTTIQWPSRLVAALHSFNWTTYYSQSVASQAYRTAISELHSGALTETTFVDRLGELTERPTEEIIKQASLYANDGALITKPKYDSFMGKVSQLTNYGIKVPDLPLPGGGSFPMGTFRPGKYIDPFVQIAGNVMKVAGGDTTPLEFFRKEVRDDLSGKNGSVAFDVRAGRLLAGVGLSAAAMGLAAEGILNGSGPSDPKQSREWQRINGMPHGLRIGDMSYDMLRMGPLGMRMSIAADLYNIAHEAGTEDMTKAASDLVHAFAQNILDESFMRGPAELMQAIDDHDRYGAAWVRNFLSSWTPWSVGSSQIARMIDPYAREARTTVDAMIAKLPFASESLFPRRDVWGEPIQNRGWAGTYYEHVTNDPVDSALYSLGIYPAQPERRIRGVQLTDQQYDDYSRVAGRTAHMRVSAIVGMPGFNQMPVEVRHDLIVNAIKGARDTAATVVMMQNPSIITRAKDAKLAKLRQPETVH